MLASAATYVASVFDSLSPSLTSMSLAANKLGRNFVATIADALTHNTTLLALDIHRCGLSDAAVAPLGPALDANAKLQELNLSWNDVRDGGECPRGAATAFTPVVADLRRGS